MKKTLDGFISQVINLTLCFSLKNEGEFALYLHMGNILPVSGQEIFPLREYLVEFLLQVFASLHVHVLIPTWLPKIFLGSF